MGRTSTSVRRTSTTMKSITGAFVVTNSCNASGDMLGGCERGSGKDSAHAGIGFGSLSVQFGGKEERILIMSITSHPFDLPRQIHQTRIIILRPCQIHQSPYVLVKSPIRPCSISPDSLTQLINLVGSPIRIGPYVLVKFVNHLTASSKSLITLYPTSSSHALNSCNYAYSM
jgi:hypothetical protein